MQQMGAQKAVFVLHCRITGRLPFGLRAWQTTITRRADRQAGRGIEIGAQAAFCCSNQSSVPPS